MHGVKDKTTWAYDKIPKGITIIRNEKSTEYDKRDIYEFCIRIQREAHKRVIQNMEEAPVALDAG